ncbi:MAG: pseudouridylate synthase [Sandaracinaceae bacterium]|nr:pseudouridylate synthase [Sandaracinaceae bacterium]
MTDTTRELRILFQDEGMAIVDKPSGVAVHKGLDRSDDNVLRRLNRQLGTWVWPSHRLDRATSGALVFALNETAASALARAFQEGLAHKTYLAWVRGAPEPRAGVIDHPVPRSEESDERVEAVTTYRTAAIADDVRTASPRYGLVICEPMTGRYHQIRRHMRHVHCPILGDTTYGDSKENKALRAHGALHRLALHALALSIPHWQDVERRVEVVAPIPEDLRAPMKAYGVTDETLDAIESLRR